MRQTHRDRDIDWQRVRQTHRDRDIDWQRVRQTQRQRYRLAKGETDTETEI